MAKVKKETAVANEPNVVDLLGAALAQLDAEQSALEPDDPTQATYRNCRTKLHATIQHIQFRLYGGN